MCDGIDRLNGLIQKLTQLGQPPSAESKLAKLKESLEIPTLKELWVNISLKGDLTYDDICTTCKRYDKAMDIQKKFVTNEVHMNTSEKVVCSYSKCGKVGHTAA